MDTIRLLKDIFICDYQIVGDESEAAKENGKKAPAIVTLI